MSLARSWSKVDVGQQTLEQTAHSESESTARSPVVTVIPLFLSIKNLAMASANARATIDRLYTAFINSDGDAMASCYHPDATFSDPVFPSLKGREVGDMWRFLCAKKADPSSRTFTAVHVSEDGKTGSAHWEARYKFPLNGNPVHNSIDASFTFVDGLIYDHCDSFDFYWWSRQAFGLQGLVLGWTAFFQVKVQQSIRARFDAFVKTSATETKEAADGQADIRAASDNTPATSS